MVVLGAPDLVRGQRNRDSRGAARVWGDVSPEPLNAHVSHRRTAIAAQRPAVWLIDTGWPKQALASSEVSTLAAGPAASIRPPRSSTACVVVAGSSSRWWVTRTVARSG